MQKMKGTLAVEEIKGRNGPFCVGTLSTSIGDFKVKDPAIDQFKVGVYRGEFVIDKIYTKGVPWRGGFFTEMIARIATDGYLIDDENQSASEGLSTPSTQSEPDPIDDTPVSTSQPTPAASVPVAPVTEQTAADEVDLDELFGLELAPKVRAKSENITLDSTIDREQFRKQCRYLTKHSWEFKFEKQSWIFAG